MLREECELEIFFAYFEPSGLLFENWVVLDLKLKAEMLKTFCFVMKLI